MTAFPPNGHGVYDMIGNVWEWTTDWYSQKHDADAPKACCIPENPRGGREDGSYDPALPDIRIARKVIKHGADVRRTCRACKRTGADSAAPNIIMIVSDDTGYGDLGPYGGGIGRGMPTPNIDKLAAEGMTFFSFYAQPSCTPGRAAMQTGRIPNRSGMTTVAFQGQGGGLPAAEWTLASVLKTAGYKTFFTGKWHLGEADYALPNAQGYDEMKNCGLYHLNAYTYADPTWFPDMDPALREMFARVTKGSLSGNAGQPAREDFKINGQYVDTPAQGVVGIPFFDGYVEKAALDYLDHNANAPEPIFMSINFMKVHQPNMPHPDYIHKSMSKSKYADSVVELDARIGRIMDKIRSLPNASNTLVFYTTDNGAWQDVYPDAGYTPFRGTKGTLREGGNRVPAVAWMPGKIAPNSKNHEIVGGLDLMATFASVGGARLPTQDRANQPIIFDSYDISPVMFGTGKSPMCSTLLASCRARLTRGRLRSRSTKNSSMSGSSCRSKASLSGYRPEIDPRMTRSPGGFPGAVDRQTHSLCSQMVRS